MRRFWILPLIMVMLCGWQATADAAAAEELQITLHRPGATVSVDRLIGDDKVLLSVTDATRTPLFGFGASDFAVTQGGRSARIVSVQPLAESLEVPRHIVLVLDNSDSMLQRNAVAPLLAGVDELLKIVRPIDQVQIIVFDSSRTVRAADRDLRVRTFTSNQPAALRNFVATTYRDRVTASTMLYEAMLAGVESIRNMPADEPKFMVVFSDGEDLNSSFKGGEVVKAAAGLARFDAYAIDYLPGATTDPFLAGFVAQHGGQVWKATSEAGLVPIFQSVASKMQYYYVVSYLFPVSGRLTVTPASLTIDELVAVPAPEPVARSAELAADEPAAPESAPLRTLDATILTLRPEVDTPYGVARWQVVVGNARKSLAELAGEGTPPAELRLPLPTGNLADLAAGGDLTVTLTVQDRKGQEASFGVPPLKLNVLRTSGYLSAFPPSLTIEEIRTLDASPMLGHIYFADGSSEIPADYVRLADPAAAAGFNEQQFRDTLEKYYQVLNIIGQRLADNPAATITLVGCNAHSGAEAGNPNLSGQRAAAVQDYLQTIWGVAPERMLVEVRNLPEKPSTSRRPEGQAENRRVEIRSADAAILDLVRSTYLVNRIDATQLLVRPVVESARGISRWRLELANAGQVLAEVSGDGEPPREVVLPLPGGELHELAAAGDLVVALELRDRNGQELLVKAPPVKVNFERISQRQVQKEGLKVQEKYALILFDFDSNAIDARNQGIVDAIAARIRELPHAKVEIVGHTDNIGKEEYNLRLSERRALAVYQLLTSAAGEEAAARISYAGVGPHAPLYDNATPQARAFNRTVTITLDYLSAE
jgi:outer membrane protein OmpA-like peptidoglycan-associated protein